MVRHVERKAISLQIHNLAQKNILHSLHLHDLSPRHGIGWPPVWSTPVWICQIGADSRSPDSRGNRSLSHNIPFMPLPYTLNFRTTISLPRPPRCIIVTHKGYTYAGLYIRRILLGRATYFHIENVFREN
jgi:hypothetical protein